MNTEKIFQLARQGTYIESVELTREDVIELITLNNPDSVGLDQLPDADLAAMLTTAANSDSALLVDALKGRFNTEAEADAWQAD